MLNHFSEVWITLSERALRNFQFLVFTHHVTFVFEFCFARFAELCICHVRVLVWDCVNFFHVLSAVFNSLFERIFSLFPCSRSQFFLPWGSNIVWRIAAKFCIRFVNCRVNYQFFPRRTAKFCIRFVIVVLIIGLFLRRFLFSHGRVLGRASAASWCRSSLPHRFAGGLPRLAGWSP